MSSGNATVDIQDTLGAAFVGLLFHMTLFGLEIAQAWTYYWRYLKKDRRSFKLFIAILLCVILLLLVSLGRISFIRVMDTISTIMSALSMYRYLILNFGNAEGSMAGVWYLDLMPVVASIPTTAVELYYVRRAYLMSQSIVCPVIVVPLILGSAITGCYLSIRALVTHTSNVYSPVWLPCVWMSASVFGDILVTATICWSLYRRRTGFARTDSTIMTLMINTLNSGFLLSALGTVVLITYTISDIKLIWLAVYWVQSKCFVNSLLAMLNCRDDIRNQSTSDNPDCAYNLHSIRLESQHKSQSIQPTLAVSVHRATTSDFAGTISDRAAECAFEDPKPCMVAEAL